MIKAEWIANNTKTLGKICIIGNKTYTKYNSDKCIWGIASLTDGSKGPVLISETKDGARYYCNGADSGAAGSTTISYGGLNFYVSNKICFQTGDLPISSYYLIPGSFDSVAAAARTLLSMSGFQIKYDDSDLIESKKNLKRYLSPIVDKEFLKRFDEEVIKTYYCNITVLDENEKPISRIEGRVGSGSSVNISNSSMRRTCILNFFAEEAKNDLTNVNNLLAINKRIKIELGFDNTIDTVNYADKIWFNLGTYVITQPSLNHTTGGVNISLNCQDKMCLLNGTFGGILPTSVIFHEYDQMEEDGSVSTVPQLVYDIIQTLVCNYGNIPISKIYINDVQKEIKQLVRWVGSSDLYFDYNTGVYSITQDAITEASDNLTNAQKEYAKLVENYENIKNDEEATAEEIEAARLAMENYFQNQLAAAQAAYKTAMEGWAIFKYNEDIGYWYTPFTYPGELISGIGDNVCSVLDTIVNTLGNYEYFFDLDGNFIFQEIQNNLNTSYDVTKVQLTSNRKPIIDEGGTSGRYQVKGNNLTILDQDNYMVDFSSSNKVAYDFKEGNTLISSYSNSPDYTNVKNDFHVWGDRDSTALHYHLVLKKKPTKMNTYKVVFLRDNNGDLTGRLRLAKPGEGLPLATVYPDGDDYVFDTTTEIGHEVEDEIWYTIDGYSVDKDILLPAGLGSVIEYTPSDWRAELYLQGLTKQQNGVRPDIYEQELLDLFDSIYDFTVVNDEGGYGAFKTDIVTNPNDVSYWFDYLEPAKDKFDFTVDVIGTKIYAMQEDKITRLYDADVPDLILIQQDDGQMSDDEEEEREYQLERIEANNQSYSNISRTIFKNIAMGTKGYSAHSYMRDLLYRYTNYNEVVNLSAVPIYYLDTNTRISVEDRASDISGDYITNTINVPFEASGTMNISATRALNRI